MEKMSESKPSDDASLCPRCCRNWGGVLASGQVGALPAYWPDGSRCI